MLKPISSESQIRLLSSGVGGRGVALKKKKRGEGRGPDRVGISGRGNGPLKFKSLFLITSFLLKHPQDFGELLLFYFFFLSQCRMVLQITVKILKE